jgi:hypothetical protein
MGGVVFFDLRAGEAGAEGEEEEDEVESFCLHVSNLFV